mmetsp:Transcript_30010/g.53228  ORF Transcript_30010/g.53228 Transcript_30010/m.53228 type:complete len:196 (+) Transcript_30010:90-677(+)
MQSPHYVNNSLFNMASTQPKASSEIIVKMHSSGMNLRQISDSLGLSVEEVNEALLAEPRILSATLSQILKKTVKFRCAKSGRLMADPVICEDGKAYDKKELKKAIERGMDKPTSVVRDTQLKHQVQVFCKQTIKQLEMCLANEIEPIKTLPLLSECFAILDADSAAQYVLGVIGRTPSHHCKFCSKTLMLWCLAN